MKALRSARSVSLVALACFAAHLPSLAPSLEDIDSINFALGLRDYDIASHQPHPPGYPVYIALGRLSLAVVTAVAPSLDAARAEALALAAWSALGGLVALIAAWFLFAAVDMSGRAPAADGAPHQPSGPRAVEAATWAAVLLAVCPLFWISGLRPLSDLPGLAAALSAQALIVRGMRDPRQLIAGAFIAGLAAGIRVQTVPLTMPLLLVAAVQAYRRMGARWVFTRPPAALAVGGLAWAVPLLVVSGGPAAYLRALGAQAGEDFAWVDMLWANPTPRRLALSMYETLVLPWSIVPLAAAVSFVALVGALVVLRRQPRALLVMAAGFGVYGLFHLLFQETVTVRYALPLMPPVAWLAARGALAMGRPGAFAAAATIVVAAVTAVNAGMVYGGEMHPAFRAIADMQSTAPSARPAAIHAHYALRRALQASAPAGVPIVEPRRNIEWLGLVDYWRGGGRDAVWFLADPLRTDLDLIDPHARRPVRYRWTSAGRPEFSGTRPLGVDWYALRPPGWFAGEGWSLTPETGGIARAMGTGLDRRPIDAYVRRGRGPLHLVVGGGSIAASPAAAAVAFDLSIDGRRIEHWTFDPGRGPFLRFIDLPDGVPAGPGDYARLTIAARAAVAGGPPPSVAIRQFDIQPAASLISGFGEGWHEEEYDNATGRRWRWTSGHSVVRVSPVRNVGLRLRGESPLRYFDDPPIVRVSAGDRVVGVFRPDDDFEWQMTIDAGDIGAAGGAITIDTDRLYLPGPAEGTSDERQLGLRLLEIAVYPVAP